MSTRLASALSYFSHPALIPLLGFAVLLHIQPFPLPFLSVIYSMVFLFVGTFLLPALFSVLLLYMGVIDSVQMEDAESRRWPFLISIVFFLITGFYLQMFPIPLVISRFIVGGALGILFLFILLPFTKASAHLSGIGGFSAFLLYLGSQYDVDLIAILIPTALATGLVATARLILKAHTPIELALGYSTGFGAMYTVLAYL
jgi:hypothetical protein